MNPSTVFDRLKTNGGYISGPQHAFAPRPDQMGSPDPAAAAEGESKAPNYRDAESPAMSCKTCDNFDEATRNCSLYNFQAQPYKVCDSFTSGNDQEPDGDGDDAGMDPMMGGGTLG